MRSLDDDGREVAYSYDAANRVLIRTVEPDGARLHTRYEYDTSGHAVRVTDAANMVTATRFDLNGNAVSQTRDAEGARATTTYTHNARGQVVTVVQPGGARTDYVFDDLGRRIKTISDPGGLRLTDTFEYDNNGNLSASTNANGGRTRYAYDSLNRLVFTVDPLGHVKQNVYDIEGRVARTVAYARPVALSKLATNPGRAAIAALLVQTPALDTVQHKVYDKDGRVAFELNAAGAVTAYRYDANGNVTSRLDYANRINMASWVLGKAPAPIADSARDVLVRTVYDARNRPVFVIDARGQVVEMRYGQDGNVSEKITYVAPISAQTPATKAAVSAALVPNSARDQRE